MSFVDANSFRSRVYRAGVTFNLQSIDIHISSTHICSWNSLCYITLVSICTLLEIVRII